MYAVDLLSDLPLASSVHHSRGADACSSAADDDTLQYDAALGGTCYVCCICCVCYGCCECLVCYVCYVCYGCSGCCACCACYVCSG